MLLDTLELTARMYSESLEIDFIEFRKQHGILATRPDEYGFSFARALDDLRRRHLLVQRQERWLRADRDDRVWVDLLVAHRIMTLDVGELGRVAERGLVPVQVAHPTVKIKNQPGPFWCRENYLLVKVRITTPDVPEVALEVLLVDDIEADNGRVQTDVKLSHAVAEVERTTLLLLEVGFCAVKRLE